jgi:hypothetical protein
VKKGEHAKLDCISKNATISDEDLLFDLGLEKFGVNTNQLKESDVPRRRFRCWVEEWEDTMENDPVMRAKLLAKYGGLVFDDIDQDDKPRMTVSSTKMKWIRANGWYAMAEPPNYDGMDSEMLEPMKISEDVLIHLISLTEQPAALNVRMIKKEEEADESEEESSDGEDAE